MSYKKINLSNINATVGMRFKSGAIAWPDLGVDETFDDLLLSMYPELATASVPHVLWGGTNSTPGGATYTIAAGAAVVPSFVTFQKLRIPATTFVAAATAVCVIVTTYPSVSSAGDPTTFSDGSTHNVLQLKELHVIDGSAASPGYVCDYADLVFLQSAGWVTPTLINGWTGSFEYKVDNGRVETRGTIDAAAATNAIFFQFPNTPVNIRPTLVQGAAILNSTDTLVAYCNLGTNGNIAVVVGYIVGKLYTGVNLNWEF